MRLGLESPEKWGLIRILNRDGTVARDIRITAEQLTALQRSYTWRTHGVTQEELDEGRAAAYGMGFEVGDVQRLNDGSLMLKFSESVVNGAIAQRFVRFMPGEWRGDLPTVTVDEAILAAADWHRRNTAGEIIEQRPRPIESIQAGEMVKR